MSEKIELTPKQIVKELDTYIIGQEKAKKAVAIALRNRIRRLKLSEEIREEVAPKNILMIGPTGVGKTEIARRLAKLTSAPFLKVEATKYTEVGYVGRDVESMIRDLMAVGFAMAKTEMQEGLKETAEKRVEEALLDLLLPPSPSKKKEQKGPGFLSLGSSNSIANEEVQKEEKKDSEENLTREKFRQWLREEKLEDKEVEILISKQNRMPTMEIFAGGNIEDLEETMQNLTSMFSGGRSKKKMLSIKDARKILLEEELEKLVDNEKVSEEARKRVEEMGIIFIDEIDKIAVSNSRGSQDVSREGVQRDILPIVEGSTVNTKHGPVDTTHILFIAAGAFNLAKPSDLIPELQGRFPLRVELDSLTADDFKKILTEPKNALTKQYVELLKTEDVTIKFNSDAIDRMSSIAQEVNAKVENIGARRLHTIMETILEELSFEADERSGETVEITSAYVEEKLSNIVKDQDLSKYIL